jgi:glycosyltransferase involved in cell wall biosynthesis
MMLRRLILSSREKRDYVHSVISLTGIGTIGEQLLSEGIEVSCLGMRSVLQAPIALWRLTRKLRKEKPTVVQTWMYHSDLIGGIAARLAGIRNVVWGIHSTHLGVVGKPTTVLVMRICALLSGWVPTKIICVAHASKLVHISAGYEPRRVLVIPNGLDLGNFDVTDVSRTIARETFGVGPDDIVVGTMGRFDPAKDYENFVSAAAIVAKAFPEARFVMAGRGLDSDNSTLSSWIEKTSFANRFVLLGERRDPAACLAAMDVFCLSSRSEALPTVVAEAMAVGTPCVVTDVGDSRVLVGDAGVVVPKEDPGALAEGISQMLSKPLAERLLIGKRGYGRVASEYSIELARVRFEALYAELSR